MGRLLVSLATALFNVVVVLLPNELYSTCGRHAVHEHLRRVAVANFNGRHGRAIRLADDHSNQSPRKAEIVVVSVILSAVYLFVDSDNLLGLYSPQRARMGAHTAYALHELRRFCKEEDVLTKVEFLYFKK